MADPGMERKQLVDLSKHPSGVVLTIQNVVSTVNMDCKLDLKTALEAHNAEYNPKHLVTVTMRIREPKTTALIFASGQMVLVISDENYNELVALFVRAKSIQQSKFAARSVSDNFEEFAHIVQKLGFPAKFKNFKIQNMLSSCDIKFPIRLEGLAYSHGAFCSYEPEICPGLIYRMKQPKMVLLILASGKVVLNGAKVQHEAHAAFENIYLVLTEFRKSQQCRWLIAAAWNGIICH